MKIYILLLILLIPLANAITCYDAFVSTDDVFEICGYCSEDNGSICTVDRNCNMTIYYENFSLYEENIETISHSDGSYTYNITQDLGGDLRNLTNGNYFGDMICDPRSRDKFSFVVYTPSSSGGSSGGGGSRTETIREIIVQENESLSQIPDDINEYYDFYSSKLVPSNKRFGGYILILLFLIFIFLPEIIFLIRKVKPKKEFK